MFLRQSTSQDIRFGPFVDSTDGVTAETALTIAQADMQLSKDGAAFAQKNTTGNATHDADGWYVTTLDTTDTGTVGELYMQVNVSGALPVWVRYWVIEETIYDSLYGASAGGYLAPTTAGRTLDVTATGEAGIDLANVNIADGPLAFLGIVDNGTAQSVTATTLVTRAANPDNSIQAGMTLMAYGSTQGYWQSVIIDSVATDTLTITAWPITTPSGTITYYVQGTPEGSPALLPDVNVLQISGDATAADNCEAFFDGTGYAGTNNVIPTVTTLTGHTAQTGDCFARLGAPAGASVSADIAAIEAQTDDIGVAGAGLTAVPWNAAWDTEVESEVNDALVAFFTSSAQLVDDIWDEPTSGHVTAGTTAVALTDVLADTAEIGAAGAGLTDLGGMSTAMKAEVNAEADTALTDYDGPTNAEMEARTPTAAQLAYIVANAATGVPVTFTTAGGSTTAAVLNLVDGASASATNDQYNGRLLVFTNGTLKDVVTDITDYNGTTKVATITAIPTAPTSSHTARLI